ncbi:MAG TPA: carboxypeptidase regulatory-like domain-containing protein [Actinomycetota bacterium]|nr:carboxypeptidase regulatory-like domain-containing protein [Actinomycetota bacterium]
MRLLLVLVLAAAVAAGCDRSPTPPPPAATVAATVAAPANGPSAGVTGVTGGGGRCVAGYESPDDLSESYRPGAPVREVVGQGHVLTGTVRSIRDCAPVAGARVELWPDIEPHGHPEDQRAAVITGPDGGYRFQSDPPDHIHILVSAEGFETLSTNRYHPEGRTTGRMDILLVPSRS